MDGLARAPASAIPTADIAAAEGLTALPGLILPQGAGLRRRCEPMAS